MAGLGAATADNGGAWGWAANPGTAGTGGVSCGTGGPDWGLGSVTSRGVGGLSTSTFMITA